MATLASTVVDRIYKPFSYRAASDVLQATMDGSQTTLMFSNVIPSWGKGTVIEIETEAMFVIDVDRTQQVATLERGWLGTTPVSHSAGSQITLGPRTLRSDIVAYMNQCLVEIFPMIYQIGKQTIVADGRLIGYELNAGGRVYQVSHLVGSSSKHWRPLMDWEEVDVPTTEFASGRGLMIYSDLNHGKQIEVRYEKPFNPITALSSDLEADVGMQTYMTDIPYYYAMSRLLSVEEIDRSQISSAQNHQRAQDVPPFSALRTGEWYKARFDDLLRACRYRLITESRRKVGTSYGS